MRLNRLGIAMLFGTLVACSTSEDATDAAEDSADVASNQGTILEFEFDGEVTSAVGSDRRRAIASQIQFMVGDLAARDANLQMSRLETSVKSADAIAGGLEKITYHAKVPVAWFKGIAFRENVIPESYELVLPKQIDAAGLAAFSRSYESSCGGSAHGADNFWYDFRPRLAECQLDGKDVIRPVASVRRSARVTEGRSPEYSRFWSDGVLNVVLLVGANGSASDERDEGVRKYKSLTTSFERLLSAKGEVRAPTRSIAIDTTIAGSLSGARVVTTLLMVDSIHRAEKDFDARYDALSTTADVIVFSGHSELGKNIRAIEQKGQVAPGQYQVYFLNGCSTFNYIDGTIFARRKEANGESDPNGTKFVDVVMNALPSTFDAGSESARRFISAMAGGKMTYDEIMEQLPRGQVVVVEGEEDNPG